MSTRKVVGWRLKKKVAGWTLLFTHDENKVIIEVEHNDNSIVCDTGEDIGDDDEIGYRLTSHAIEKDYNLNGEANAVHTSDKFITNNWEVIIINDNDNHLNIHCKSPNLNNDTIEYISSTDGKRGSKNCVLVFSTNTNNEKNNHNFL